MTSSYQGFSRTYLKECFSYDTEGRLYWRERPLSHFASLGFMKAWNKRYALSRADTSFSSGYRVVHLRGKKLLCHRVIFLLEKGELPEYLDHINRDRLDNRVSNLRRCSLKENSRNSSLRTGLSVYKGVHFHAQAGKWVASIRVNYKSNYLGMYKTEEEAASAYDKEAVKHGFITNQELLSKLK